MSSPVGWGTRGIRAAVPLTATHPLRAGPWVQVQTWPWKRSPKETLMPSVEDPEEAPGGGPPGLRVTRAGHGAEERKPGMSAASPGLLPLGPREPSLSEILSTELDSPCVAGHTSILRTLLKIQGAHSVARWVLRRGRGAVLRSDGARSPRQVVLPTPAARLSLSFPTALRSPAGASVSLQRPETTSSNLNSACTCWKHWVYFTPSSSLTCVLKMWLFFMHNKPTLRAFSQSMACFPPYNSYILVVAGPDTHFIFI